MEDLYIAIIALFVALIAFIYDKVKKSEKVKSDRSNDENKINKLKLYAKLFGSQKTKAMFLDEIALLKLFLNQTRNYTSERIAQGSQELRSGLKHELDWSIAGGIAQGIAGPAAGLAAALDAQEKNAHTRQYNAMWTDVQNRLTHLDIQEMAIKRALVQYQISWFERSLKKIETQQILEKPQNELLALLSPKIRSYKHQETGSIQVSVHIQSITFIDQEDKKKMESLSEYHRREAERKLEWYIDGSFKAIFIFKGTRIGEAVFVLPYYAQTSFVESICFVENPEECEVIFEPCQLWLTEPIAMVPESQQKIVRYKKSYPDACAFMRRGDYF